MREQLASGFRVSNSGHDSGRESIVNTGLTQICVVRDLSQVDTDISSSFSMPIARCSTERISTDRLVRNTARCCVTGNRFNCSISTKSFQALLHDFRSRSEISSGINSGGLAFACRLLAVRRVGIASSAMAVSMLASLSSACGEISRVRLVSVSHNIRTHREFVTFVRQCFSLQITLFLS